jgi:hypothetical protein
VTKEGKSRKTPTGERGERRSWRVSLTLGAAIVGASILLSATVNPLFGRAVHWDWMAALAPTLFVALVLALHRRWV